MDVKETFETLRNHINGGDLLATGYAEDLLRALERAFFQSSNTIEVWMSDDKKIYFGAGIEDLDSLIKKHIRIAIDTHICDYHGIKEFGGKFEEQK